MAEILQELLRASEKAACIARACRQEEALFQLLIEEKKEDEKNKKFLTDFKTLADVLVQEVIKHDLGKKFPDLEQSVRGEESNEFTNELGEKIIVKVCPTEKETASLLQKVLDNNKAAAKTLARAVHQEVTLTDKALNAVNVSIPLDNVAVWVDPIDSTYQYIKGSGDIQPEKGIYPKGLQCVTVLIGVFLMDTGHPVMGVINQPFAIKDPITLRFHIMSSSSSPESDRSGFFYGSASPTGMENSPQHHSPPRSPTLTTSIMADEDTLQEDSCTQGTTMDTTHSPVTSQNKKTKKRSNAQAEKGNKSSKKKFVEYAVDPTDFTTEGVIELVQSHPSLWDKEDPRHSDVVYNRKKWDEIYLALFPEFDSYGKKLQKTIMDLIQKRWRNVRDSYFKHLRETNLPSGSGARKSTYKYSDRLSFLHKVQELRQTTSNTAVPLPIQEEHVEQPARFEDDDPSNATPTGAISSGVRLQRNVSRRNSDNQRESLSLAAVQKLEEISASKFLHIDVRLLRLEGLVTGHPPSPSKDFLMTLVPQMERMSEEQQSNYKRRLIKVTQECLNYTPPPPSYSPMCPPASPSVQLSRQRNYTSNYAPRYEDTFEEDGQVYRRV